MVHFFMFFFFFSSRRRHTRFDCDWSSDVCSSDLALLAAGEDERQRTGPELRRERGRGRVQVKVEASEHVASRDQQEKRLVWRSAFEPDQLLHRFVVYRATEPVHGFRRVSQHPARVEVRDRTRERGLDLLFRPERNRANFGGHSRKVCSASARAKSGSSVIFIARSLPGTTTTGYPSCSHSAASSVALIALARA